MEVINSSYKELRVWLEKRADTSPLFPFQEFWYLDLFSRRFSGDSSYPLSVHNGEKTIAVFPFDKQGDGVTFTGMVKILGNQEVTDYGDIVMREMDDDQYRLLWSSVLSNLKSKKEMHILLEYVREDSRLYGYFKEHPGSHIEKQEVSPYISLPPTWEVYLDLLDRVERKELRRKLRRLDSVPHSFEIYSASERSIFDEFITLHRLSDSSKKQFMSEEMERFFHELAVSGNSTWQRSFARLTIQGKPAAVIFFFENNTRSLLYNSGYDPGFGYYSSGLMAHALLIRRNIEKGKKIHDFLRGGERYKYDLGAIDMNLYKISINL